MNFLPEKVVSGDSKTIRVSAQDLADAFKNPNFLDIASRIVVAASRNGKTKTFDVTQNGGFYEGQMDTSGLVPGIYIINGVLFTGQTRETFDTRTIEIYPDPLSQFDYSTEAESALRAVDAALLSAAKSGFAMLSIDGRMTQRMSIADLMRLRSIYKREVAKEKQRITGVDTDNILMRFTRVQ